MIEAVQRVLSQDERIAYALVFGSVARGSATARSDLDIAVGLSAVLSAREMGDLIGRLEAASGRDVDLIVLDEAPPALAYRVFRDGDVIVERDRDAFVRRKARAILDYLDFKPLEDICTRAVLQAAKDGR